MTRERTQSLAALSRGPFGVDANTLETPGTVIQRRRLDGVFPVLHRRVNAAFSHWRHIRLPSDLNNKIGRAIHRPLRTMRCRSPTLLRTNSRSAPDSHCACDALPELRGRAGARHSIHFGPDTYEWRRGSCARRAQDRHPVGPPGLHAASGQVMGGPRQAEPARSPSSRSLTCDREIVLERWPVGSRWKRMTRP